MIYAHRFAYETFVGVIPKGKDLDHTCHNADTNCRGVNTCIHRRCVNPQHLEPATRIENRQRAMRPYDHNGHAYDALWSNGKRMSRGCRACRKEYKRKYKEKKKEA